MTEKFHQRFNIKIPIEEARRRFVNRARNQLLSWKSAGWHQKAGEPIASWHRACESVATQMGEVAVRDADAFAKLSRQWDFNETLRVLEALNVALPGFRIGTEIQTLLSMSEVDLGVRWEAGCFLPSGAKLLDDALVNEPLHWIREKGYVTVLVPFEKALGHLVRGKAQPELLTDVVTNAYEAVEALGKIVTGKDAKLDAIQQEFLAKLKASDDYKKILKEYIAFAHKFRHGAVAPEKKPSLAYAETESFVYLTGVFIRLAISAGFTSSASP